MIPKMSTRIRHSAGPISGWVHLFVVLGLFALGSVFGTTPPMQDPQHQCRKSARAVFLFFFASAASFAWPLLWNFLGARAPVQKMMLASSHASLPMVFILPLHLGCYFLFFSLWNFVGSPAPLQDILLISSEASLFEWRTRARTGHVAGPVLLLFSGCFLLAVSLAPQQQCRIPTSGGNLPGQCFFFFFFFFMSSASFAWPFLSNFVGAQAAMQEMMLATSQASFLESAAALLRDMWLGSSCCFSWRAVSWQCRWNPSISAANLSGQCCFSFFISFAILSWLLF